MSPVIRPCPHPGCPNDRDCPKHRKEGQRAYDRARGTARQRGYDEAWDALARAFLTAEAWCWRCGEIATIPHHIIPVDVAPEYRLEWSNLEPCCASCHGVRHAQLRGAGYE